MIHIKTPHEIKIMEKAGKIMGETMEILLSAIKPGISELEIDALAEKTIREKGGEPGFKKVEGYHHTICVSTNDVSVHGVPSDYKFQANDIVGIDCGVFLDGFHTDMAETVRVKSEKLKMKNDEIDNFLEIGKEALEAGIAQVKAGNRVGHISRAIQQIVEIKGGYSIVRSLVGHGVGKDLHEEPEVPGYLFGSIEKTPLLKPGMTIAVEVIYNMGGSEVIHAGNGDNWTIKTADGSLAGLFERTVLVTENGHEIITPLNRLTFRI